MIDAWLVVREEKHIDDKFWICLERDDALTIAKDVAKYWLDKYEPTLDEIDEELYGSELVFNLNVDDSFRIYVSPTQIREKGET